MLQNCRLCVGVGGDYRPIIAVVGDVVEEGGKKVVGVSFANRSADPCPHPELLANVAIDGHVLRATAEAPNGPDGPVLVREFPFNGEVQVVDAETAQAQVQVSDFFDPLNPKGTTPATVQVFFSIH